MTIELISQETYQELLDIQKDYPVLTFNFKGYGGLNRTEFSKEEVIADKRVNEILALHVKDFKEFQNFCTNKGGELRLRFQYHYDHKFTGVGYIKLTELLNGFENN